MAKRSQQLTLEVGPDAAIEICTRALLGLGWEVSRDGERLTANESAAKLCCQHLAGGGRRRCRPQRRAKHQA